MSKTILRSLLVTLFLAGCVHRGAVRVECEGPLHPINRPMSLKDAPVTVAPGSPEATKTPGTAP
jgi:hypothetical protein